MSNRETVEGKQRGKKTSKKQSIWSSTDDEALLSAVSVEHAKHIGEKDSDDDEDEDWETIAKSVPGKTAIQCLKRYMKLNKESSDNVGATIGKKRSRDSSSVRSDYSDNENDSEPGDLDPGSIPWGSDEVELLRRLVEQYRDAAPRWNEISLNFRNRTPIDCLTKWQSMTNPPVIKGKGSWTPEEDAILREKRMLYGRKWAKIASHLPGRQGKQCRERFVNHLDVELKKGEWTDDEEAILIVAHETHGNRWANIAKQLRGRSDNDVKNHWYSTIQRKFQQHGKEKLVNAAKQQVQMMQRMGTMPSQQQSQQPQSWSVSPYNQATGATPVMPAVPPPYPYYPVFFAPPPGTAHTAPPPPYYYHPSYYGQPPPSGPHYPPPSGAHYPPPSGSHYPPSEANRPGHSRNPSPLSDAQRESNKYLQSPGGSGASQDHC